METLASKIFTFTGIVERLAWTGSEFGGRGVRGRGWEEVAQDAKNREDSEAFAFAFGLLSFFARPPSAPETWLEVGEKL